MSGLTFTAKTLEEREHGSASTYQYGCRCASCKAAHAARIKRETAARVANPSDTFKHGKAGYGNHGCRCDVCRTAMREYQQRWAAARKSRLPKGYEP